MRLPLTPAAASRAEATIMTALAAPGGLTFDPTSPDLTRSDWLKIYLGFAGMALGQFMAMLDMQIVASSLSQIQAGVGANADEIA